MTAQATAFLGVLHACALTSRVLHYELRLRAHIEGLLVALANVQELRVDLLGVSADEARGIDAQEGLVSLGLRAYSVGKLRARAAADRDAQLEDLTPGERAFQEADAEDYFDRWRRAV